MAFLYPFAWLLAASFKPRGEVFDNKLIPETFLPQNYVEVWEKLPLLDWMGNSIAIAVLAAGPVAVSSSIVAFGFAYFRFPSRLLFGLVLASMMLPGAVTMVPNYLIWKRLGWLGTWVPLWGMRPVRLRVLHLPAAAVLPVAAQGAVRGGAGGRLLVLGAVLAHRVAAVGAVVHHRVHLRVPGALEQPPGAADLPQRRQPEEYTVPLGIAYAMTQYSPTAGGQGDYQYVMVASLLVTLPMMIIFAFGQRYFIEGVATAGLKG